MTRPRPSPRRLQPPVMTSTTTLTVATANTCTGDLLRTAGGLEPFRTAGAGIVGLQEVFGVTEAAAAAGPGERRPRAHPLARRGRARARPRPAGRLARR